MILVIMYNYVEEAGFSLKIEVAGGCYKITGESGHSEKKFFFFFFSTYTVYKELQNLQLL